MSAAETYFNLVLERLYRLRETQLESILRAAELCAERISQGGLIFLFGVGHSRMLCEEMMPRQGAFPGFVALVEQALSNHASVVGPNSLRTALYLEKYQGYAEEILKSIHFGPPDALIVISTSGVRPVIVEMAMGAKKREMPVVAITSVEHNRTAPPAHPSGKKLLDLADIVIDNCCPAGDCVLELEGLEWRTGPASTVTGAMIINMIRCQTAEFLLQRGTKPVLLPSHQFAGKSDAVEQLERFYEAYRKSLRHLYE